MVKLSFMAFSRGPIQSNSYFDVKGELQQFYTTSTTASVKRVLWLHLSLEPLEKNPTNTRYFVFGCKGYNRHSFPGQMAAVVMGTSDCQWWKHGNLSFAYSHPTVLFG